MAYFQYKIPIAGEAESDIAIALLIPLGFYGFEQNATELLAFSEVEVDTSKLKEVMQLLSTSYSPSVVEQQNWNAQWEREFQPIEVLHPDNNSVFAYVRAHFHPAPAKALHDIIITPKMSFGTGHHATTYGMMAYMSKMNFQGKSVVDFGTGTGVLAILAEKLGAAEVFAIDNDPWCIRNSEENITVNNCNLIQLKETDHFEILNKPDIILANINLNIIKSNLSSIVEACNPDTSILFSGILEEDESLIREALEKNNIGITALLRKNGWLIIAAKKSFNL